MPVTRYTSVSGRILAEKRGGTRQFYGADPLGSTAAIYDSSGNVTDTFTYWPYGEIRTSTGSSTTPFKFCGAWGYYGVATGRLYVRARYFRDQLARWQTADPLWPNLPAYTYALNSPVLTIDGTGLQPTSSPGTPPWHPPAGVKVTCSMKDTCIEIRAKLALLSKMISTHSRWDWYIRPGLPPYVDKNGVLREHPWHAQEIAELWIAFGRCQDLLTVKCKGHTIRFKNGLPEPVTVPCADPVFAPTPFSEGVPKREIRLPADPCPPARLIPLAPSFPFFFFITEEMRMLMWPERYLS